MVHPAIIGGILAVALVGTIAVLLFIEDRNRSHYGYEPVRGSSRNSKGNYRDSEEESDDEDMKHEDGRHEQTWPRDHSLRVKSVLKKRRGKKSSKEEDFDMEPVNTRESELQDRLSYMNAMEQEIERKQQVLAREQALLIKQEDEIRARREKLQNLSNSTIGASFASLPSISSSGSASTDVPPFVSASASTTILPLPAADLDITLAHEEQQPFAAIWSDRAGSSTPSAPSTPHSSFANPLEDSAHSNLSALSHVASSFHTSSIDRTPSVISGTNSLLSPPGHTNPLAGSEYFHRQPQLRVPSSVGSWSDVGTPRDFSLVAPHADTTQSLGSAAGGSGTGAYEASSVGESPSLVASEFGSDGFIEVESLGSVEGEMS